MGVYLTAEGDARVAIETTMIGSSDAGAQVADAVKLLQPLAKLQASLDKKVVASNAWKSFAMAVATGTINFAEKKDKFDAGDDPDYQVTDIDQSREEGILPISYAKAD